MIWTQLSDLLEILHIWRHQIPKFLLPTWGLWNKSERQASHITYVWNLKNWHKWTYLPNRNRLPDIGNKFKITKMGREQGEGWDQLGVGINRYTLLYTKYINNRLYSTGNYTQYLIITYNGKDSGKEYIYIYIYTHTHICKTKSLWN